MSVNKVSLTAKQQEFLKFMYDTRDIQVAAQAFQTLLNQEGMSGEDYVPILKLVIDAWEKRNAK